MQHIEVRRDAAKAGAVLAGALVFLFVRHRRRRAALSPGVRRAMDSRTLRERLRG